MPASPVYLCDIPRVLLYRLHFNDGPAASAFAEGVELSYAGEASQAPDL